MKTTLPQISNNDSEKIMNQVLLYENFNKAEMEIITLFSEKKIGLFTAQEKKNIILAKILQIQGFLAIKDKYDKKHYIDLVNYLCENYAEITVSEMELAVQLAVAQKTGDFDNFTQISAALFSKIINAYLRYISPIKLKINKAVDKRRKQEQIELIEQNKDALNKAHLLNLYNNIDLVTDIDMFDIGNTGYDYLVEHKLFSVDIDTKNKTCLEAKRILHARLTKKLMDDGFRNKELIVAELLKLAEEINNGTVLNPETPAVISLAKKILLFNHLKSLKNEKINIVNLIQKK
jgi:hypothetical protein